MTEEKIINSQEVDTGFRIPDGDYQPSINKHLARLSFVKITETETSLTEMKKGAFGVVCDVDSKCLLFGCKLGSI